MEINDKMTINLEGIGEATATVVKNENGKTWFVFDGIVGNSSMYDVGPFLFGLATKFPQPIQDRLREIRLLNASEVFSDCDMPGERKWLEKVGVTMGNSQISYFKSVDHRRTGYRLNSIWSAWWLCSVVPHSLFTYVGGDGRANFNDPSTPIGVRPLFVLNDKED